MLKKRLLLLAIIIWGGIIIGISIRPTSFTQGVPKDQYWSQKVLCKNRYDVIITGDSRSMLCVSPSAMKKILGDLPICNYSFTAVCYTAEYLNSIESALNNSSKHRIIILGISPQSFTSYANEKNAFKNWNQKNGIELLLLSKTGWFIKTFDKFRANDLSVILGGNYYGWFRLYHWNGWVASRLVPERPAGTVYFYRDLFSRQKVSEKIINYLLKRVREWSNKGIVVFAFRAPISKALLRIENSMSGFKEQIFKKQFSLNGGIWLNTRRRGYHLFDSSHMRYDSAVLFSRELAALIKDHLNINKFTGK